jgi:hypothetical protein
MVINSTCSTGCGTRVLLNAGQSAAALAQATFSRQDLQVAAEASRLAAEARGELTGQQQQELPTSGSTSSADNGYHRRSMVENAYSPGSSNGPAYLDLYA